MRDQLAASRDLVELGDQGRQIGSDDDPHDVEVDLIVSVDESVPHPDDLGPGYLRVRLSDVVWDTSCRFPNYLQQAHDGEAENPAGVKISPAFPRNKAHRLARVFAHLAKRDERITQRHRLARPRARPGRGSSC